jgi:hypothetical protein
MGIVTCNPSSHMGIGRIVLVGRFIIECSPDGWTGTDLGLGLKIVVLPLNALMLKDNFASDAKSQSSEEVAGFKCMLYFITTLYFIFILQFHNSI